MAIYSVISVYCRWITPPNYHKYPGGIYLALLGGNDAIIDSVRINCKQLSKEVRKCHTNFAQHTVLTKEGKP